ncbi:hypothetical protein pdam_00023708 [Pocillopora damicornis]|uniref:Ig-like domain-containing protein n=1 Tax=Pocillopora damicornis TaxID=46731 RepID=A0A3M6U0S0_POCDA|nr:hypothetical protein pdam_00023708 [Pocillopora damicornis]
MPNNIVCHVVLTCIVRISLELQSVWISSPTNPTSVIENENLNLQWSYKIDGSLTFAKFFRIGDGRSEKLIALKSSSNSSIDVDLAFRDRFIFNISNDQALVTLVAVQRSDSATYRLQIANQDLLEIDKDVKIRVLFQPSKTSKQCPGAVTEGHTVKLLCNFTGDPLPSVAWNRADTRRTLSNSGVLFLKDIKRSDSGIYECLAWNGIGNNSTEFCMIDVGKKVSLYCRTIGNPVPTISWNHEKNVGRRSELYFDSARLGDQGWYKCTAKNGIGSPATARTYLDVAERASNLVNAKMTITNEKFDKSLRNKESRRYQNLSKQVIVAVEDLFRNDNSYNSTEVVRFESGSVVVIFNLRFEQAVDINRIISVLKHAARDRKLGKLIIDPSSIAALQDYIHQTTRSPRVSSSGSKWIIGGALTGSVVFILICIFTFWFCWRRRKRRHRPSTSDPSNEVKEVVAEHPNGNEKSLQIRDTRHEPSNGNEKSLQICGNKGILQTIDPSVLKGAKSAKYTRERRTSDHGETIKESFEVQFS